MWVQVWVSWGWGTGSPGKPQGYPCQSLTVGVCGVGGIDLCVVTAGIGNISRVGGVNLYVGSVNVLVIVFIPSVSLFFIMMAAVAVLAAASLLLMSATELWLLVSFMLSLLSLEGASWIQVWPVLLPCPVGQDSKLTLLGQRCGGGAMEAPLTLRASLALK